MAVSLQPRTRPILTPSSPSLGTASPWHLPYFLPIPSEIVLLLKSPQVILVHARTLPVRSE